MVIKAPKGSPCELWQNQTYTDFPDDTKPKTKCLLFSLLICLHGEN